MRVKWSIGTAFAFGTPCTSTYADRQYATPRSRSSSRVRAQPAPSGSVRLLFTLALCSVLLIAAPRRSHRTRAATYGGGRAQPKSTNP